MSIFEGRATQTAVISTPPGIAFGAASLALLRFTGGAAMAAVLVAVSLMAWLVAPLLAAVRALSRADI